MTSAKTSSIPALDRKAAEPFYRQIYDRFRGAISSGILKPGDRIPSARALTKELGLARGTIEAAYSLLAAEGYIQARGQAGTIVTPGLKLPMPFASAIPQPNTSVAAISFRPDSILPFQALPSQTTNATVSSVSATSLAMEVAANRPALFVATRKVLKLVK